jgi:PKD repeat protein
VLRATGEAVHPQVTKSNSLGRVSPALRQNGQPGAVLAATPPTPGTPAYLQQAYDLAALSQTAGGTDTVAVVDAFNDPTAGSDLATYRSTYGLPACTFSNGCFKKVGQTGSSVPSTTNASWRQETSLDLDAVSAVCPKCQILLVEANSDSFSDLEAAMQTAANLGADQISASWGGVSSGVPSVFRTFAGVATVAAAGDTGYVGPGEDSYPAALPGVTAAGGTSLAPANALTARGFGEGAWSWNGTNGGSSGCDLQFQRPAYQPAMGCAGRAYADVSADADPATGLKVYNNGTWGVVGGTSLSTPLIAAYYAITGVDGTTPQWAYGDSRALNDIVSGSSGNCATAIAYICNAGAGYDGPTGVGSISGSVVTGAPGIGGPSIPVAGAANTYTAAVSAHGATISGGIYRNGLDTKWSIQYGPTTSYGTQTTPIDVGAGSTPVAVTGYLSQLTPGSTYHYRLVAQNTVGTTYGYDYTFTTLSAQTGQPTAVFTMSASSTTPGGSLSFDASTSSPVGSISDYSWNFGDGTGTQDGQTTATMDHIYAQRGIYTVTLTVTSNGQTDTSTQTVTVDNPPTASFTPSDTEVPAGATVSFNAAADSTGGSITDYNWNFDDGTTQDAGTSATASHTFSNPGSYDVTLTTTDDLDVTNTKTVTITVAAFTVSPSTPAPGSPVTLTAVNPGAPAGTTYTWNLGDGSTPPPPSTSLSIQYTYSARGAYKVSLTITTNGTAGDPSTGVVNVDTAPTPAFTSSANAVLPGTPVNFDGSGSTAATGGSIADYSWNFGDGTPAQDTGGTATTSHTFAATGTYTVTLTATDDLGASAPVTHTVIVDQPTAAFAVSPSGPTPNVPVTFDASGSSDPESMITDYSWNFGDGTTQDNGATAAIQHTYIAGGTYTVTLTVKDGFSLPATTSRQVVVAPASTQSTGGSTPPPAPTPAPVTVITPSPTPPSTPLVARLSAAGRQRLTAALTHGLKLGLTVNQLTPASFQISIPMGETRQAAGRKLRNPNAPVVLLRGSQNVAAGAHTVVLKLSRAAARQLAGRGPLVLTVRITLTGANGKTQTRTAKITLTR